MNGFEFSGQDDAVEEGPFGMRRADSMDFIYDGDFISYADQNSYSKGSVSGEAVDQDRLEGTLLLSNALNLLYGPAGYGKSYTSVEMAAKSGVPVLFVDLDSNNSQFAAHCKKHGVEYLSILNPQGIPRAVRDEDGRMTFIKRHEAGYTSKAMCADDLQVIETLCELNQGKIIIIDSFSDIYDGDEQNGPIAVQNFMRYLGRLAIRTNNTLLVLEHATYIRDKSGKKTGFKIEGNESGKIKKTACVLRIDENRVVTVERSRSSTLLKGESIAFGSVQPRKKAVSL